jgi:hypothetical protein
MQYLFWMVWLLHTVMICPRSPIAFDTSQAILGGDTLHHTLDQLVCALNRALVTWNSWTSGDNEAVQVILHHEVNNQLCNKLLPIICIINITENKKIKRSYNQQNLSNSLAQDFTYLHGNFEDTQQSQSIYQAWLQQTWQSSLGARQDILDQLSDL